MEIRQLNDLKISEEGNKIFIRINNFEDSKPLQDNNGNSFIERVPKEAWEEAIQNSQDIKIHYNHQNKIDIAKEVNFIIRDDGIYAEITLREGTEVMYEDIKSNPSKYGVSFGFKAIKDSFIKVGNYFKRIIESMQLFEVSILDIEPAYNNTVVEARNYPALQKEIEKEMDLLALELELLKLK